jgi:hypothetical protein
VAAKKLGYAVVVLMIDFMIEVAGRTIVVGANMKMAAAVKKHIPIGATFCVRLRVSADLRIDTCRGLRIDVFMILLFYIRLARRMDIGTGGSGCIIRRITAGTIGRSIGRGMRMPLPLLRRCMVDVMPAMVILARHSLTYCLWRPAAAESARESRPSPLFNPDRTHTAILPSPWPAFGHFASLARRAY